MANGAQQVRLADGQLDWTLGVDSSRAPTIAGENNPNGLPRNAVSWANNVIMRGGGIRQRTGFAGPVATIADSTGLYQGGIMYEQTNALPYLIVAVSGRFYRVRLDTDNSVEDITGALVFPATEPLYHFVQGEQYMLAQTGDMTTLPAIWDGTNMTQSVGIISANNTPAGGVLPYNQIPAAGPMVYYQGRIWYAYFRKFTAGDALSGAAGTSVITVTENPLAIGGDGFGVPTQAGNIRAMNYVANLDSALGEGTLFVFTRKQIYAIDVPVDRTAWIAANANNMPLQRVVQRNNGGVGDRCVVAVNGDLYYQSLEPSIRSLMSALRYFNQPGNTPISTNIQRALDFNDRALMRWAPGTEFDNRLYQAILPEQRPQGVIHKAIATMDFDPITTMGQKGTPIWEGISEGLDVLQLFNGDFGGRERCFAVVVSRVDNSIQLWEITNDTRFDGDDKRVNWYVEFPAFTWGREFDLKRLDGGEIWIDKVFGTVDGKVYYRTDGNPCWQLWHVFRFCTARSSCETVDNPVCYPLEVFRESGKFPVMLPVPPLPPCNDMDSRPMNTGHQFQVKIEIQGWCRIRGLIVYAVPVLKTPFGGLECLPSPFSPKIP